MKQITLPNGMYGTLYCTYDGICDVTIENVYDGKTLNRIIMTIDAAKALGIDVTIFN